MEFERDTDLEDELLKEMVEEFHDDTRAQPSVSGMIKCLTRTYYESEVKKISEPTYSRRETQLFSVGLALEKVILGARQIVQGGEHKGIQWHVDHIGTDQKLIEFKSTRIKAVDNDEPKISPHWQKQYLAYLKTLGVTEGHFVMLHVMGDYAPPFPDLRAYRVITTQEEIDANWTWIEQRAITYLKFVKDQIPPTPFEYNEPWECKDCPWLALCNTKKLVDNNERSI